MQIASLNFDKQLPKHKVTDAVLEAHLMTIEPENKIEEFAQAGADLITFHIEATNQSQSVIHKIKGSGSKAGVALNPATPLSSIEEILYDVDIVLLMTAIPGGAGHPLLKHSIDKVKRLHNIIRENDYKCFLEVDGGITIENAKDLREAGANILVSDTALYESTDVWASLAMLTGE